MLMPRVAVVGAGAWGKNHVRVFHRLGALDTVVDLNDNSVAKVATDYPDVKVTKDFSEVLADQDIRGVVLATPAETHFELAKQALLAGKDVLVEKPMTLSVAEAEELVDLADKHNRVLMVGHLLLYKSAVQAILRALADKAIGDIRYVEMRRIKLGKVRAVENVLWCLGSHDVAVLLKLIGAEVASVIAHGIKAVQPHIDDDVHVHLEFVNGVKAHLHSSWFWPEDERKLVIIGSEGMITYDEHKNEVLLHHKRINPDLSITDNGAEALAFPDADALEMECKHFLECIEKRTTPLTDGVSGVAVIKVLAEADQALADN